MLDRSHEMLVAHSLTTQETLLDDPNEHCSEFSIYLQQQIFQTSLLFLSIPFRLGQIEFRLGQMSS